MIAKRSISIRGRKTSISLEDVFWDELKVLASLKRVRVSQMVAAIRAERLSDNLSSAIRMTVLQHYRSHAAALAAAAPVLRDHDHRRQPDYSHGANAPG